MLGALPEEKEFFFDSVLSPEGLLGSRTKAQSHLSCRVPLPRGPGSRRMCNSITTS